MRFERSAGILLHPTSLPGNYGIGDLGEDAFKFVDFLKEAGQTLWQLFPLGPTGYGDSPYQCFSAFAGNPLLVSPDKLKEDGFLSDQDLSDKQTFNPIHRLRRNN
jgi:4-alpha-glucanotransferase